LVVVSNEQTELSEYSLSVCRYGRQNVVALGKFALNLTGFPREQGSDLVAHLSCLLSTLVTKVCQEFLICSN